MCLLYKSVYQSACYTFRHSWISPQGTWISPPAAVYCCPFPTFTGLEEVSGETWSLGRTLQKTGQVRVEGPVQRMLAVPDRPQKHPTDTSTRRLLSIQQDICYHSNKRTNFETPDVKLCFERIHCFFRVWILEYTSEIKSSAMERISRLIVHTGRHSTYTGSRYCTRERPLHVPGAKRAGFPQSHAERFATN